MGPLGVLLGGARRGDLGRPEAEAGGEECWKGHGKPGKYEF